jgi:hypothetical protein
MDLFQFQHVFGDLTINANGSMFGEHVAVSADGDTVVIGIPGDTGVEPKIRTFRRTGDAWAPLATDLTFANASSDEPKSYLFNLSADGSRLLVHRRNGDRAVMLANMVSDAWVVDEDFYIDNIVACVLSADGAKFAYTIDQRMGQYRTKVVVLATEQTVTVSVDEGLFLRLSADGYRLLVLTSSGDIKIYVTLDELGNLNAVLQTTWSDCLGPPAMSAAGDHIAFFKVMPVVPNVYIQAYRLESGTWVSPTISPPILGIVEQSGVATLPFALLIERVADRVLIFHGWPAISFMYVSQMWDTETPVYDSVQGYPSVRLGASVHVAGDYLVLSSPGNNRVYFYHVQEEEHQDDDDEDDDNQPVPCFHGSTRLQRADGTDVAIADVRVGDELLDAAGQRRRVERVLRRERAQCMYFAADALAPGVPIRPLLVTPNHLLRLANGDVMRADAAVVRANAAAARMQAPSTRRFHLAPRVHPAPRAGHVPLPVTVYHVGFADWTFLRTHGVLAESLASTPAHHEQRRHYVQHRHRAHQQHRYRAHQQHRHRAHLHHRHCARPRQRPYVHPRQRPHFRPQHRQCAQGLVCSATAIPLTTCPSARAPRTTAGALPASTSAPAMTAASANKNDVPGYHQRHPRRTLRYALTPAATSPPTMATTAAPRGT